MPLNRLNAVLEEAGLDLSKPVVTSCGSGVTAAVITLALQSLGHKENKLYDGSWLSRTKIESEGGFTVDLPTGRRVCHGISVCSRPWRSLRFRREAWDDALVDRWLATIKDRKSVV